MQQLHNLTKLFNPKKEVGKVWKLWQQLLVGTRTFPHPSLNWDWQARGFSRSQKKPQWRKWHKNSSKREQALPDRALAQAWVPWTKRGGDGRPFSELAKTSHLENVCPLHFLFCFSFVGRPFFGTHTIILTDFPCLILPSHLLSKASTYWL